MNSEVHPVESIKELDEVECWHLLQLTTVGRLAVSIRNRPDIFPVNYAVDNGTVVINTAPGTKLAAAVLGRAVAFEVDGLDPISRAGWSVVLKGSAAEVSTLDDLLAVESLGIDTWAESEKRRYLRLTPDSITGRRI